MTGMRWRKCWKPQNRNAVVCRKASRWIGSEFSGRALEAWAMDNEVWLCFIRPGRPAENGFIESFGGRLRDECLNVEWFSSLDDARQKLAKFREHYNQQRPHSALAGLDTCSVRGAAPARAEIF